MSRKSWAFVLIGLFSAALLPLFPATSQAADTPNQKSLDQLARVLQLAERKRLYLDLTGLGCYHKRDVPEWYDKLAEPERWDVQADPYPLGAAQGIDHMQSAPSFSPDGNQIAFSWDGDTGARCREFSGGAGRSLDLDRNRLLAADNGVVLVLVHPADDLVLAGRGAGRDRDVDAGLSGDEQKAVKTTALDLQNGPDEPGLQLSPSRDSQGQELLVDPCQRGFLCHVGERTDEFVASPADGHVVRARGHRDRRGNSTQE